MAGTTLQPMAAARAQTTVRETVLLTAVDNSGEGGQTAEDSAEISSDHQVHVRTEWKLDPVGRRHRNGRSWHPHAHTGYNKEGDSLACDRVNSFSTSS